ncbi:MAG: hypothetical protein NC548_28530 [Lachnospiraceae bacterium]|nr:hypothetical protein [Lachnospiraceae bacterium]
MSYELFKSNVRKLLKLYGKSIYDVSDGTRVDYSRLQSALLFDGGDDALIRRIADYLNLPVEYLAKTDVDINNKKLVFFDFDRTLFAHNYPTDYAMTHDDYEADLRYLLKYGNEVFSHSSPVPAIQKYAELRYEQGSLLYCITHQVSSIRSEINKSMLDKYYNKTPMRYIAVSSRDLKVPTMRAFAYHECALLSNVTIVEDNSYTVNSANLSGMVGIHMSSICTRWEESHA